MKKTPEQRRLERIVAAVLVSLAAVSVAVAVAGVWPSTVLGDWLGSTSLRLRLVSAFVALGLVLLAALLAALLVKALAGRR